MAGITIAQLFYDAYKDAGVQMLPQFGLSPDQMEEARTQFNRMIDSLQLDGRMVSHVARLLFPITLNQGDYTVGPGGDWDPGSPVSASSPGYNYPQPSIATCYPVRIERASMVLTTQNNAGSGPPEYPIFPLTIDQWQSWTLKQQTTNFPRRYFYEPSYPLAVFHLLYVPYDADQVALYIEETLAQIQADADGILDFRPGYQDMLTSNLAVRIAARTPGSAIAESTVELSRSSRQMIQTNNDRPLDRDTDMAIGFRFRSDVYSGNRYGQR